MTQNSYIGLAYIFFLLAGAVPSLASAMPLNQEAMKQRSAIIIPKAEGNTVGATKLLASGDKPSSFRRLNRNVLTINYTNRKPVAERESNKELFAAMTANSGKSRAARLKAPKPAVSDPAANTPSDAVLLLYGDGDVSPSHPFNH